jgi:hypothetical protein
MVELRVTMLDENDEYILADPIAAFRGEIVMRLNERRKGSVRCRGDGGTARRRRQPDKRRSLRR